MLDTISGSLKGMKSRLVSYDTMRLASGERNELLLAILSEQEEGIVLTGLHNRESSMYAKPLKDGQSKYPLSPEEKRPSLLRARRVERFHSLMPANRQVAIISDNRMTKLKRVFCNTKYSIKPPTLTMPVTWISPTGGNSLCTPAPGFRGPSDI